MLWSKVAIAVSINLLLGAGVAPAQKVDSDHCRSRKLSLDPIEGVIRECGRVARRSGLSPVERAWAYANVGAAQQLKGDFGNALASYSRALELWKGEALIYSYRCALLLKTGADHQAVEDCSAALRLAPGDGYARDLRGQAHLNLRNYAEALADFETVLKVSPRAAHYAQRSIESARLALGRPSALRQCQSIDIKASDAACTEIINRRVVEKQEDVAIAYVQRALNHEVRGDYAAAMQDYNSILAFDPTHQRAGKEVGRILAMLARPADTQVSGPAAPPAPASASPTPDTPPANPLVAACQATDRAAALAACTNILERGAAETVENRIIALLNRAGIHEDQGNLAGGLHDLQRASLLDPQDMLVKVRLQQLGERVAKSGQSGRDAAHGADALFNACLFDAAQGFEACAAIIAERDATRPGRIAWAYLNRAHHFERSGDLQRALADHLEVAKWDEAVLDPDAIADLRKRIGDKVAAPPAPSADAIVWRFLAADDLTGLRRFVAQFPDSAHRGEALARIARLEEQAKGDEAKRVAAVQPKTPPAIEPDEAFIPADERRVALVIGNGAYRHVARLPNPANDSADVAASLKRLGFTVTVLNDATQEAMRRALRDFGREAQGADHAVVFFAGHGMEIGGENYLVPVDAELKRDIDVEQEAVTLKGVVNAVSGTKKLGLVMLDACRDNPFLAQMKRSILTRSVPRGLAKVEPTGSVLVAFASKEGTTADDGAGRNSPFTSALLKHLEAPGLEINFLFRRVRDEVIRATSRGQEPHLYGSLSSEEIFFKPRRQAGR